MAMSNNFELEDVCYDLGSTALHGLTYGDDNHSPVLCLHGWLDNAASFMPLMPYIEHRRVIAVDWPGHGWSSHRSHDAHYHFIDWVYDLLALFEVNQWQKMDIVAHSMGGMIASAFAAAFPEKVNSLTLLDSIGFISAEADKSTVQLRKGLLSRYKTAVRHTSDKARSLHPTLVSAIKARMAVSDLHYEQAKLLVKRGLVKQEGGYKWRSDSRLKVTSPYRLTQSQAEKFISDIQCPVQLIHGSKGLDMVFSGIEHFSPLFQNLVCHEVVGGHHVHMEKPQQIAEHINGFILEK